MATKRKETENKGELRLRMSVEDARKRLSERMRIGSDFKSASIQSEEQLKELRSEYSSGMITTLSYYVRYIPMTIRQTSHSR